MLFPYVSSFQNVLNDLSSLSGWDFMDGNIRVGITGCREIYRKSPFVEKLAHAFFGPLGGQIDTKFGLEVEIINICFQRGDFEYFHFW